MSFKILGQQAEQSKKEVELVKEREEREEGRQGVGLLIEKNPGEWTERGGQDVVKALLGNLGKQE